MQGDWLLRGIWRAEHSSEGQAPTHCLDGTCPGPQLRPPPSWAPPVADVLGWVRICQILLAPQPTHIFEPQDHLTELNSCLAATEKGVEASLDGAKLRTTCHSESILGSGGIYLTCGQPSHSQRLKCSLGVPSWRAHRARKGKGWGRRDSWRLAVMGAGRETKGEE